MPAVVVPLDGSSRGESVLPYACAVAAGAPVVLMTTKWGSDAQAPREYLERRAAELKDIAVDTTVIYDRKPVEAILCVAADHPDAIICMATHGRSGLGEVVLGSVAESVVRDAANPVLLVGPHVESDPSSRLPVVVAVDSPTTATAIAPVVAALASSLELDIDVVEVVAPAPVPFAVSVDTMGWPEDGRAADAAVHALGSLGLTSLGLKTESTILRDVNPAQAIVQRLRQLPASFAVVGTHARRGLARVALGSVAIQIAHHAPCPVLVVRS